MFVLAKWVQRIAFLGMALGLLQGSLPLASADKPAGAGRAPGVVAQEIDREITRCLQAQKIPASPQADDAEFLRRVYLDIVGRIPTAEKAVAFLDSKDPQKRAKLIDELLASPEYGRHFATIWANLIVANGDPDAKVQTKPFINWLAKELNDGKAWDKLVHELLTAQGKTTDNPAVTFTAANSSQPGMLGSSASKLFLGVQIQCAECHNHPFNKWQQADYWGMAAFFARLKGAGAKGKGGEVAEGPAPTKVAAKGNKKGADKGAPAPNAGIVIPATGGNKGAGKVVPAKFIEGQPPTLPEQGALRPHLASWVTARDNPFFARAAVNRLWGQFFGYGFVNPVDDFENGTEPSHPELLSLLSKEFAASGCDSKHLIRCLCNSQTYQRTSRSLPENKDDDKYFSHMAVKVMTPEVMYDSLITAMAVPALPGGLGSQPRYGDGKGKNAKGAATARPDARDEFVRFFNTRDPDAGSTDFTHGIPQLLGLLNNAQFNRVTPAIDKLVKDGVSKEKAIETLYLATFSRRPAAGELKLLLDFLGKAADPAQGYSDVLWILFNSNEFVLNH